MSKHTPGPWSVVDVSRREKRIDGDQRSVKVAFLVNEHNSDDDATAALEADAKLISAAPLMAELLLKLHEMSEPRSAARAEIVKVLIAAGVTP